MLSGSQSVTGRSLINVFNSGPLFEGDDFEGDDFEGDALDCPHGAASLGVEFCEFSTLADLAAWD